MQKDFIADLLYYIFSEDKKAHPVPPHHEARFWERIGAALQRRPASDDTHTEGD